MEWINCVAVGTTGYFGGMLTSVAGESFLTLPALIFVGVPAYLLLIYS